MSQSQSQSKPVSNELIMEQLHANMRQLKLVVELIAITNHKIDMISGKLGSQTSIIMDEADDPLQKA